MKPMDIAVVGSGVSGLGAAWLLNKRHNVTLYEKQDRYGGHSNTVVVRANGPRGATRELPVDTGFIVYNDATYPNLIALFEHLGIANETSNMSFSASIDRGRVEYSGGSWRGLFAQKRNLVRLDHWRMLGDCMRFFRDARTLCKVDESGPDLGTFLDKGGYSRAFVENHLLPMAAAIWSCPAAAMMAFPAPSLARFFNNHGLLQLFDRPLWRTVKGGSRVYRDRLLAEIGPAARAGTAVDLVHAHDLRTLLAGTHLALDLGTFARRRQTGLLERGRMQEHVRRPVRRRDEAETLCRVEPLDDRFDGLGRAGIERGHIVCIAPGWGRLAASYLKRGRNATSELRSPALVNSGRPA
jgi:predicted NAD/FAD-binding protein